MQVSLMLRLFFWFASLTLYWFASLAFFWFAHLFG
jgi:hypothetical protein